MRRIPVQVTCIDEDLRCPVKASLRPGKVGIITGGGAGQIIHQGLPESLSE